MNNKLMAGIFLLVIGLIQIIISFAILWPLLITGIMCIIVGIVFCILQHGKGDKHE